MSKQVFIYGIMFLGGAYAQKKLDVCGKLVDLWVSAQKALTKPESPNNPADGSK